jgi:hypothetical protein
MSNAESKTCLRVRVKPWKGLTWTQVYAKLLPILGKPNDIEEWQDEVEYLEYTGYAFHKIKDYWYVDYILQGCGDDGDVNFCETLEEIMKFAQKFLDLLGLSDTMGIEDVRLVSLTWYNGTDEPVEY